MTKVIDYTSLASNPGVISLARGDVKGAHEFRVQEPMPRNRSKLNLVGRRGQEHVDDLKN